MRLLPAVLLASVMPWIGFGQTFTISTFAGGALPINIQGTAASLGFNDDDVAAIAADQAGNVFFLYQNTVLRLDSKTGLLTLVAGNGTTGFSGDNGSAINAQLNRPEGLAVDASGNLYIADTGNFRLRKVSNGIISTVAGNGSLGSSGDGGVATSASLTPSNIAVGSNGDIYVFEPAARVRKVSNGAITTVVGNGTVGFTGDNGPATNAQLGGISQLAVDSGGNLYISDTSNNRIRRVSNGVITTIAGNGTMGFSGDGGSATSAQLSQPGGIAVDSAGSCYISDNNRIRKVSNGMIITVVGNGEQGSSGDNGPPLSAQLRFPGSIAVDAASGLYLADQGNHEIRKVLNGLIATVAGNGTPGFSGDNGPATGAQLSSPAGVAIDSAGTLYVADFYNQRVRAVSNGVIATVVGWGSTTSSGDGTATGLGLGFPSGVAVDSAGNLYVSDYTGSVVFKVSKGLATRVAGTGAYGFSGDNGPATSAQINAPYAIAVDLAGSLYISDQGNHRIRKVTNGVITTVVGIGIPGFSGDNGPATSAQLNSPHGIAVDAEGNLYIVDQVNERIRKVSNGIITTVAGNGSVGGGGDGGPATNATLYNPEGISVDSAGNLYIADNTTGAIRKVSNGLITTIAGISAAGYSGDNGPAMSAQLLGPTGMTVDSAGRLYVSDSGNARVRLLTPNSTCAYSVSPTAVPISAAGGNVTITIQTAPSCSWAVSGLPPWITVSGASSSTGPGTLALIVAPNSGAALTATILIAGVSVAITQMGQASACTYALSAGGQTFNAAGGNGTINITAGAGCTWTAASTAGWVTITGVGTGSGNGSVTYQGAVNTGVARSGVVTIAGLSFTVEEGGASVVGLNTAGSMAQLASAGYWTTTITLVNTASTAALVRLNFFDNNGNPLSLPLNFPQLVTNPAGPLLATTLDRTLNPGAELLIQTTGPSTQTTQAGWAQLLTNGTIGGFAVFSQTIGSNDQEAVVPLETRNASTYVLSFDNSNGADTGIALANLSAQSLNAAITISDDTGALIRSDTVVLPAMGHTSIDTATQYGPSTAGRRGTLQFTTPSPGQISVLGLRFTPTGAFTTIPPLAK
jgi:sugar lactone lactonase YvrE